MPLDVFIVGAAQDRRDKGDGQLVPRRPLAPVGRVGDGRQELHQRVHLLLCHCRYAVALGTNTPQRVSKGAT